MSGSSGRGNGSNIVIGRGDFGDVGVSFSVSGGYSGNGSLSVRGREMGRVSVYDRGRGSVVVLVCGVKVRMLVVGVVGGLAGGVVVVVAGRGGAGEWLWRRDGKETSLVRLAQAPADIFINGS